MPNEETNGRSVGALAFGLVYGIAMITMIPILTAKIIAAIGEDPFHRAHLPFFLSWKFKWLTGLLCAATLVKELCIRNTQKTLPLNLGFLCALFGITAYWILLIFK